MVLLLSGMVAMILLRALNRDIARYNEIDQEEAQDEFGWKLVHGDVFRSPNRRMLLCVFVGNGAQIFLMSIATLAFAALGFLSPATRGSLPTMMIVFYVLFGSIAGYISTRLYKLLGGETWRQLVFMTALLIPGLLFVVLVILNFFLIYANSSAAVPFGTMIALLSLWFLISIPLCLAGAYFGFRKEKLHVPVRTHQIPRQIPHQVILFHLV